MKSGFRQIGKAVAGPLLGAVITAAVALAITWEAGLAASIGLAGALAMLGGSDGREGRRA